MNNDLFRKGMVYAIVVLFIGVSSIPLIGSNVVVEKSSLPIEETVPSFEGDTLLEEYYTLNVTVIGWGDVIKNPDWELYPEGTIVELTAVPGLGWGFDWWQGDLTGSTNPDTIVMDDNKEVTAWFSETPIYLCIDIVGNGHVDVAPAGPYMYGETPELTAVADPDWAFVGWSGDLAGSENPTTIFMDGYKEVTAHFIETGILYVGGSGSGNYTKIQEAIDNASNSDTVFVFDDSSPYYENIVVDKSINLIGENKDTTVIDGNGSGDVINILADQVKINGFTVRNGNKGISIWESAHNSMSNCNIYNTSCGIYLYLWSLHNDIFNCSIHNNGYGIHLDYSPRDIYGDGVIDLMDLLDWVLSYSPCYNDILNCDIYNNSYGIYLNNCETDFQVDNGNTVMGIMTLSQNLLFENSISNCDIYSNSNGISLLLSSGNTITGNTIVLNSGCGVSLGSTGNNIITGNNISNNDGGINLHEAVIMVWVEWWPLIAPLGPSSNNIITGNNISNNYYGVKISHENWNYPSDSNQIYHNNFMNNNHQAQSYDGLYGPCENIWDNGYPSGGNYWSDFDEPSEGAYNDYHGENQDYVGSDGIVDIGLPTGGLNPYNIPDDINQDQYPLIVPYPTSSTSSPIINDVTLITSDPLDTIIGWEYFSCTVTDNDGVDEVKLIVTYPDTTTAAHTMTNIQSTNTYYYNMTLSDPGNYTYHIWANDTSGNYNASIPQPFDLPPNWDVDMNGQAYFEDLIAITLRYGDTGPPGWVREDVDNNGEVYFNDLLAVVLHYGE